MTEQEKHADKLKAVAEWFRDCKTLTLEKLPHGLIAALEAGAAALLRPSPPPALAVEELDKEVARWQDYRDKYPAEACCATSRIDSLLTLRGILIALGVAAVQSSRSGEPGGTCATCRHVKTNHLGHTICGYASGANPMLDSAIAVPHVFGCIFHTPQEPSR